MFIGLPCHVFQHPGKPGVAQQLVEGGLHQISVAAMLKKADNYSETVEHHKSQGAIAQVVRSVYALYFGT